MTFFSYIRKAMITIDHTALYVHDLEAAKDFFVRYFEAEAHALYHNPKTQFTSYFLTFGPNVRLELITRPEVEYLDKHFYANGYNHIAFSVGSRAEVNRLTGRLIEAGYKLVSGPRLTGDGYYESCIAGPEGNLIEITE